MREKTIDGFMTVGVNRDVNLKCRFPKYVDTSQDFNVNQDLKGAESSSGAFKYKAKILNFLKFKNLVL